MTVLDLALCDTNSGSLPITLDIAALRSSSMVVSCIPKTMMAGFNFWDNSALIGRFSLLIYFIIRSVSSLPDTLRTPSLLFFLVE